MILDYSEFIIRNGSKGLLSGHYKEENLDLFYSETGTCPFCRVKIRDRIFSKQKTSYPEWIDGSFSEYEFVIQCPTCGWWEHQYKNSSDAMLEYTRLSELNINTAVLRKYNLSDKMIPIELLNNYIRKNPDKIYNIHHKKMEELTQSVFKEHYNCEVKLVGKSHDGGKDLIVIHSDTNIMVQVKRRTKPDKVEPVSSIRELLGATLLSESKSCTFVTTADHFSPMAIKEADKAIQLNLLEQYELIDYHSFIDMLNLQKKSEDIPWNKLINMKDEFYD